MDLTPSPRALELHRQLHAFLQERVWPMEAAYAKEDAANRAAGNPWQPSAVIEGLKAEARAQGLWNLFLPNSPHAPEGLSNLDYAPLCELMGRMYWSPEVFNCSAPDTGNMEVLARYAGGAQQARWLAPLLDGRIRSAFLMTEPAVASSDATNLQCAIRRDGDDYVIDGRKWYASGAGDPRCEVYIVMGITDANAAPHQRHSMIVVPADTRGIRVNRAMDVYGYDDAPHGHMDIDLVDVRVPAANMLLGEGRGFEIAQGRLGPGRIHHCMRAIGMGERALEAMCGRLASRHAFGRAIADQSIWRERIAESRCLLDQARLMVLNAARMMDTVGNKAARAEIAMIKVVAPQAAEKVIDWAVQAHGAAGVSQDTFLAKAWAHNRTLRLADGPDEVHRDTIAKLELKKYAAKDAA
ncbi:acyl-CoA dehydrogenase family protein [Thermomonas carbonis]|uniref:Acyl-CoA dehydrogenase family protein n=1 Tax=Thermomonas carbonis TaxID=1463158 RepID=A0A7G9SML2_9GAMM|nr:acyl-CoA dehydrogenase family protein [Thermomonas carbonis]QNN69087.1 acyl-CoA dehydrogenase family protein [Thermomonas carbonis]